ncbi:xanthine dehydrogenase family protein molybdopterin-binding subunit [Noviherbaspirillum sp. CPCC 100848]|uniref:Xanthine dehydrogenase family protein molybdopterin-binding subunit n=1 Tax=Noviherbaspirillum album TaxID=3080276 RepID=A0ABU6JDS8_9BURK|nr:xanthine dehydrogenase family protein molybdopterin-binding subunit [Noviherbaspirillum sp. CPCC 100848]MEC4721816.1 xanthine dehydrogenase family protein molybdopterin-binding subunit [Noviherbaspirillum sp. CPCC 100848]
MRSTEAKRKSRRRFLLGGLGVAGALVVGWGIMPPRQRLQLSTPLPAKEGEIMLNGWIRMARDGIVTIAMPQCEMGQGVFTALPMLVAEELDVPLERVRIQQAPIDRIFGNMAVLTDSLPFHPDGAGTLKETMRWFTGKAARELGLMITGGSTSVKDAWIPMREAGAAARAMLVAAAAAEWNADSADCRTEAGTVLHADGRRAAYADLAEKALGSRPAVIRLKSPEQFKLIGTPQLRRDSIAKVNGTAAFGMDVRPPGMLHAAVRMAPTIGGTVRAFNADAVRGMPGVVSVVDFSGAAAGMAGLAVVAKTWWQARQAAIALPVEWNPGPHAGLSTASVFRELEARINADSGYVYHEAGEPDPMKAGVKTVEAEYRAPFLAHAAMEPVNCTAQVKDGKVTLWVPTQVPSLAINAAARIAKTDAANVELHVTYIGGGFGRRLETDMIAQAVAIAAQANGLPVQVIWSREEDMMHDMYRPAALARFTAVLDRAGRVVSYRNKLASGAITHQVLARTLGFTGIGPDKTTAEGAFDMPYEFIHQSIAHVAVPTPVPLGYWRSVGHSHNAFFKESFIDELAHAAGRNEVEFRRSLLQRHPQHLAVLDAAVRQAGHAGQGRAHGVALHQSFGSIVAQVAEVSIEDNEIRVHKVTCAIDCGLAVNPNIIAQQMESGIVFGLSAALFGEVTIEEGRVRQQNFHDYPVLRMNQAPEVHTIVMKSAAPPEGVGEPGTPPIAPAVANAVFKLTGKRLRSLPLRLA